ncbi:MAG: AraC family transcriptional regulator [Bacteroidales bacterium]
MKLYIKNMVSKRCKMLLREELKKLGLHYKYVDLGEVDLIDNSITQGQYAHLKKFLKISGLELMDDTKSILVEKIKTLIIKMIHYADKLPKHNISVYMSNQLNYSYTYLANLFKEVTGTTIQHYILFHKIEKVKELILYDELSLNEISYKLHYSSVAHLSNQFKQITGLTPTSFKKNHSYKNRIKLETLLNKNQYMQMKNIRISKQREKDSDRMDRHYTSVNEQLTANIHM